MAACRQNAVQVYAGIGAIIAHQSVIPGVEAIRFAAIGNIVVVVFQPMWPLPTDKTDPAKRGPPMMTGI